jgi:hypothetical protein
MKLFKIGCKYNEMDKKSIEELLFQNYENKKRYKDKRLL